MYVTFHGAFKSKAKADAKAERVGGKVKHVRVRGSDWRYSVLTRS